MALALAGSSPAQTWTPAIAPSTNWQSVASSADGTKLIAAGGGFLGNGLGPVFTSTNSGASWVPTLAPVTNWLHVASSADGSKLLAVGYQIYYSIDSGNTWTKANAPFPFEFWSSVVMSADGSRAVAGELGGTFPHPRGVYLSSDFGATWNPAGTNGSAIASSADGLKLVTLEYNANSAYVGLSTNAGSAWRSNSVAAAQLWWTIASSADGVKLVAASGNGEISVNSTGSIYTSTNSGSNWTSNHAPVLKWSCVASSADGTRLVASAIGGGIYTSIDSGGNWVSNTVPPSVTNWTSVASSADGTKLVAVVQGGGIYTATVTPAPVIKITPSGTNLAFSWIIPSTNFVLQQTLDLNAPNWLPVTNPPVLNLTNLQNQVTLPASNTSGFYRLGTMP